MNNWFNLKASYDKTIESGFIKKVTEQYLIDALSFTEAEARGIEELKPHISGEFSISGITRAHLAELFFNEKGDRWYRVKVQYISLDAKSGAEKLTPVNMLVQADSVDDAIAVLREGMKGTMLDWYLHTITETAIMDVFPYKAEGKEEE